MKRSIQFGIFSAAMLTVFLLWSFAFAAYHHQGEIDSDNFLAVYPDLANSKLDHCALCHSGGETIDSKGQTIELGSCLWCHETYGYDGSGNIVDTINQYGLDYFTNGRSAAAVTAIESMDSDGDGYTNKEEIDAERYPGDSSDDPTLVEAPYRIYTKSELEAMTSHTQFLLMNTSRSGDFYAEYTGVPMEELLSDAGILDSATGITVYAPDGWSNYHPLEEAEDPEIYHVNGTYPSSLFYQSDDSPESVGGWCDYTAPSCSGRSHGQSIRVTNGLKMILAYSREGSPLEKGVLNDENKLDGEGPFRLVVPQKNPGPPDQSSKSDNQNVTWPYDFDWDHNAGSCSRSATIIKVEPLPEGTTDINVLEAGWDYVDEEKVIVYGAIRGASSTSSPTGTDGSDDDDDSSICFIGSLH
jgi:hypothetical protein